MNKIRVLVVDDSVFIRTVIPKLIESNGEIQVIGTAKNGKEAVEMAKNLKPDIITMDVEMPEMNGIEALKIIMNDEPMPVLMLSSLTKEGAQTTVEALTLGAIDFVFKGEAFSDIKDLKELLIEKIKLISNSSQIKNYFLRKQTLKENIGLLNKQQNLPSEKRFQSVEINSISGRKRPALNAVKCISIGVSTGGPFALQKIIPKLPASLPVPILITQHMPAHFTQTLSERLDHLSALKVKEAVNGEVAQKGTVYFAPGGRQMLINQTGTIIIQDEPVKELYKPSVNITLHSVVQTFGSKALGIIMTGMGSDGAAALKELSHAGGYVIAQDPDSCVVSGMVRTALDMKAVDELVTLDDIANFIIHLFN